MNKRIKIDIPKLIDSHKIFFFFLLIAIGITILYPRLNFQPWLSSGDHGRDLYCFKKTFEGGVPYRDYWWVYGPLMPYYYALCFLLCGITIKSVLLGAALLNFFSGIIFYLAISFFAAPFLAFIATLWFWTFNPDFFFTYNHIGGVAALLGALYYLFSYIKKPSKNSIYLSFACVFILALIKANIGISTMIALIASFCITDFINKDFSSSKRYFYLVSAIVLSSLIGLVYLWILKGLPFYYIRQCFPYARADHQIYSPVWDSLYLYWQMVMNSLTSSLPNLLFGALIIFSAIHIFYLSYRGQLDKKSKNNIMLVVISFVIFSMLNLHEFLNSGVYYRTFWVAPFKFLVMFIIIATAIRNFSATIKILLGCVLLLNLFLENSGRYRAIHMIKKPLHYLSFQTAQIYVGNSPQWIDTVKKTTDYLNQSLKNKETFFALPYDPLYYFLAQKDSPTRQLIFFDHINIKPEQEKEIITKLEKKKVNWIVLSNRSANVREAGLGTFGETYCPLLAQYIYGHFKLAATFGDWQNEPGWAWNHGTKIFKRIQPR